MRQHLTHPPSLLAILSGLCLTASRHITEVEILQKTTCGKVYEKALDNRGQLNFSNAIGNLTCKPGPYGFVRYHCMTNEDGHDIQFCTEWIWIEPGLCPRLYSVQSIINPEKCEINGCPKDRYQSHMYYNFSVCFTKVINKIWQTQYGIVYKNKEEMHIQLRNRSSKHPSDKDDSSSIGIIIGVVFVVAVCIGIVIYCRVKNVRQQGEKGIVIERSKPFTEAVKRLNNGEIVMLTGKNGEGISTFIKSIHGRHFRKYKWKEQDYGFNQINGTKKIFLVIGERGLFVEKEWGALKSFINNNERQTKIVIDVPRLSYNHHKGKLDAECGDEVVVGMDLSSDEWKMDEDERKELVGEWMRVKKIDNNQLSECKMSQIVHYESDHYGFCYICRLLFNGSREEVIEKLENLENAFAEIEEGNLSSRQTKSDMINVVEIKPLIHS